GHLRLKMLHRHLGCSCAQPSFSQESKHAQIEKPEKACAKHPAYSGEAAEATSPPLGNLKVGLGDDPGRSALEKIKLVCLCRNLRDELDRAGASADYRNALALQRDAGIPGSRVKCWPGEVFHSGNIGVLGHMQPAHSRDQNLRLNVLAVGGG